MCSDLLIGGLVDPGGGRQRGRPRRVAYEALGRGGVGRGEDAFAVGVDGFGVSRSTGSTPTLLATREAIWTDASQTLVRSARTSGPRAMVPEYP